MTTKENILKTLKTNKPKLSKLGIRNVGLFGSYIRNEQSRASDIDLLTDFEPEKEALIILWRSIQEDTRNIFKMNVSEALKLSNP